MVARLIDSHCHLTDPRLLGQIDAVVQRARDAGLGGMLTVGTSPPDGRAAVELANRFADVWVAVAIHPHRAGDFSQDALQQIDSLLGNPRVVAVGEIGLDYHSDFAPREVQEAAFGAQLRLAARRNRPVIIHSRESIAETLAVISRVAAEAGPIPGVFHSFTGTIDEAKAILAAGFFISLSGVVTFRKSEPLQAVARMLPADRLLVETDAPYLSPEPVRKIKTNEPAHVVHTLRKVAELRGVSPEQLAEQTAQNARRLFGM